MNSNSENNITEKESMLMHELSIPQQLQQPQSEEKESPAEKQRKRRAESTKEDKEKEALRGRKRRLQFRLSGDNSAVQEHLRKESERKRLHRAQKDAADKEADAEKARTRRREISKDEVENRKNQRRERLAQKKREALASETHLRHVGWRKINQYEPSGSEEEAEAISKVSHDYSIDLQEFRKRISSPLQHKVCSICGIRKEIKRYCKDTDSLFDCLHAIKISEYFRNSNTTAHLDKTFWWKYPNPMWDDIPADVIPICDTCHASLSRYIVPLTSRACYPIKFMGLPQFLCELSELEQALISPILPMILVFQHYSPNGQYKSYGQSIALENNVDEIAKVLPRRPEQICLKIPDKRGSLQDVRPHTIRKALEFFKSNGHPGFTDIKFSEENFTHLCEQIEKDKERQVADCNAVDNENESSSLPEYTATTRLLDAGQNQIVEKETASICESIPIGVEPLCYTKVLRDAALEVVSRSSKKNVLRSHVSENWELKFPLLLPEGTGGPNACTDPERKLSVEEWIKYVIQVEDLDFSTNVLFILYANNVIRRRKITGIACNKTISLSVRDAMDELLKLLQQNRDPGNIEHHFSAVQMLLNKISYHTNDITGSVQDKAVHRQNILSMYNDERHGAPQLFVTLSAAESFWPETFVFISKGKLSLEEAKALDASQRASLIAKNPVRVTMAWKERVAAFLNLIINGKSKPLGTIRHYIWTAEWQTRLSEHIHLLLWTDANFSGMQTIMDDHGNVRLGSNSSLLQNIERFASMQVPFTDNSSNMGCTNIHEAIIKDPIEQIELLLDNSETGNEARSQMKDLVRACNIHRCSNYCTRNGKLACKSGFPHRLRDRGQIIESVDAKQNSSYRAQLKRNNKDVNTYNVPILNAWRANMDVSALLGDAFGACVYVAYYTSKKDKSADLHKVINKLKNLEFPSNEQEQKRNLNRILLAVDSCKATGAPEASSNILGHKHHFTSTKIDRILHRSFVSEASELRDTEITNDGTHTENLWQESVEEISSNLGQIAGSHPLFDIRTSKNTQTSEHETLFIKAKNPHNKFTTQYMERPTELEHLSHQEYHQNYKVNDRPRKSGTTQNLRKQQMLDNGNRVVERRPQSLGSQVILDLKYRPPPNIDDEQWCAGALILHSSYRSVTDILRPPHTPLHIDNTSFCAAYSHWVALKVSDGSFKYPKLLQYENSMKTLQSTTRNIGTPHGKKHDNSDTQESAKDQKDSGDFSKEDEDNMIIDYEDIEDELRNALPLYSGAKSWTGTPSMKHAVFGTCADAEENYCQQSHSDLTTSILESKDYTSSVYKKVHPPDESLQLPDDQDFKHRIANGTPRKEVAGHYKNVVCGKCRTATQEHAFHKAATALEDYFSKSNADNIMLITGVAGSGKSFVSGKFSIFASLLLDDHSYPYDSPQAILRRESHILESDFSKSVANLENTSTSSGKDSSGSFQGTTNHAAGNRTLKKRVHTVAYSGAAAGVAGGFTIHHALGLTRNQLTSDVSKGIIDLPHYRNTSLESFWEGIKAIVIDEVYFIDAAFLNIIHQRLCQIKQVYDKPFGGLFVLMIGDPQQIKALSGEPLYRYNYFYPATNNTEDLLAEKEKRRNVELSSSPGAQKGFQLYGSCNLYCHMPESQRLADIDFQRLTLRAASYELSSTDISELNTFSKSPAELYTEKWLDAIWILPTWNEINRHHFDVTSFMAKTRGILRIWSQPVFDNTADLSPVRKRQILLTYFQNTSTDITRDFTEPLPYMDIFPGQILCLKENYVPSLNFYKNSRVVVVGVHFHDETRILPSVSSVEDAVSQAMHPQGQPKYDVLVRFYTVDSDKQFKGISALTGTSGVFSLPWTRTQKKVGGVSLTVHGVHAHPGNAGTGHGSQGATFSAAVASVSKSTTQWYGWANVAISRTKASTFALRNPVSLPIMLAQKAQAAIVRNELNRLSYLGTPQGEIERNWIARRAASNGKKSKTDFIP